MQAVELVNSDIRNEVIAGLFITTIVTGLQTNHIFRG